MSDAMSSQASLWEVNAQKLREILMSLGFTYDERRRRWVGHGVEVSADITWRCARPWLVVRRRGLMADIYVKRRYPWAKVEYVIDSDVRPSEEQVVEFHRLVQKLFDEVSKIEPKC